MKDRQLLLLLFHHNILRFDSVICALHIKIFFHSELRTMYFELCFIP